MITCIAPTKKDIKLSAPYNKKSHGNCDSTASSSPSLTKQYSSNILKKNRSKNTNMMMRSSSTPVLGSLLSPISPENPNHRHHHHHDITLHPYKTSPIHKLSLHQTPSPGSQHFTTLSCHSSPISPSFGSGGIRRVQSEGNLESLMSSSGYGGNDHDDFSFFNPPKKVSSRLHSCSLETIPSFSYQNSKFRSDGDESDEDEEGFCEFRGFNTENKTLSINKQIGYDNLEMKDDIGESGSQMYPAKGIGVDAGFGCAGGGAAGSGGGGRNLSPVGGGGGDSRDVEEHYRKMVNECPGNPLLLGNYAQFLYQKKQDLQGAEEYYSRAILVDPNDGGILSQYAKLLWEVHAYASFLWETEGEEEEEVEEGYYSNIPPLFNNGKMASAATA
ncbi:hypothetical protein E3N88_36422 [Mikania micrantha]|uniref:Uncharacterized protein n=1 Tax=Mikania micrantha TaxID=192012 RepID=A0A5N6M472_9ASTR|nr:hypothetical protein E3N88_36422 [Mikania micrantha]